MASEPYGLGLWQNGGKMCPCPIRDRVDAPEAILRRDTSRKGRSGASRKPGVLTIEGHKLTVAQI